MQILSLFNIVIRYNTSNDYSSTTDWFSMKHIIYIAKNVFDECVKQNPNFAKEFQSAIHRIEEAGSKDGDYDEVSINDVSTAISEITYLVCSIIEQDTLEVLALNFYHKFNRPVIDAVDIYRGLPEDLKKQVIMASFYQHNF